MKIVAVSNFDDESVCDLLICENIKDKMGKKIVRFLNDELGDNAYYFYTLVENEYKLY